MKAVTILLFSLYSISCFAQDVTPITINLRDNSRLQFNNNPVKMKATVEIFQPISLIEKEIYIRVLVQYYESVAGAYGNYIPQTIGNDNTLSAAERTGLNQVFGDREVEYTTKNQWVDVSGNSVPKGTPGAITELAYWQGFALNQVPGVGTVANTGAMQTMYLTITAIVNKLNTRKQW